MKTAAKPRRTAAAGRRSGQGGKGGARSTKSSGSAKRPGKSTPARVAAPRRWNFPTLKLGAELRRDIVAVALVVLALLTFWSLFGERGGLLGLWGDALRRAFGWAAILVPLMLLLWVVDGFRPHPVAPFGPRRRHLAGTALFLVALLGLLHLPAPDPLAWGLTGRGGGYLGYLVAAPLAAALRPLGAGLVLLGLSIVALVVALNTNLRELGTATAQLARRARQRLVPGATEPQAPPTGEARQGRREQRGAGTDGADDGPTAERPDPDDGGPVI